MPIACVDNAYEETITIVSPVDSLVSGFIVPIDSMKLGTEENLPFGFIADCGSPDCTSYPTLGIEPAKECIRLVGFPATAFASDTVFIPVTYYVTLFGFPTPLEGEVYTLLEAFQPDTGVSKVGTTLIAQASSATYQWLDCNDGMNPIIGQTGPSFTAVSTGNYAVEITENGCTGTSECYTVDILSVDDMLNGQAISIFPNPSTGIVNIDLREVNQAVNLRAYNSLGKMMHQQILTPNTLEALQIDLPNGIYILELSHKNGDRARSSIMLQK